MGNTRLRGGFSLASSMNRMACSRFQRREGFKEIVRVELASIWFNEGLNRNTSSFGNRGEPPR